MFDLFHIPIPNLVKIPQLKKGNYFSTFFLGLSSGLLIAPCTTPVLGSILVMLAGQKNFVYGGLLLLSFAYGMGLILMVSALLGAEVNHIFRAGPWTVAVKKIFAFFLVVMGAFFIVNAIWRI
jgi:thiol:disulfide interchange protein DsbD